MGKGDKKSKKGKIRMGSFGKVRPRKKAKLTFVAKKVEKKEEVAVVEKTETKKKTTKKKAAVKKKTATKKAAKKKA